MKILLIEDDLTLNKLITKALKRMKYTVEQAYDGQEGLNKYRMGKYDVIVLDLNLPYLDGMELLTIVRENDRSTKILILSARSTIDDKITGFEAGATDYLTKPFDILELELRINNLLRWNVNKFEITYDVGNLTFNRTSKEFLYDGNPISLTRKEYGILEQLTLEYPSYVSSERLISRVWEGDEAFFSNSLKFHIHSLRKKIATSTDNSIIINSKRGFGYSIKLVKEETT